MGCAHPALNCSKRMLYRLLSDQHTIGHVRHDVIHSIDLILMLPSRYLDFQGTVYLFNFQGTVYLFRKFG